jgi:MarR family transcriptional regulator for hemolysin
MAGWCVMDAQQGARAKQLARLLAGLDQTFREDFKRSNGIPYHLTLAQFQVISMVAENGRCSQKEIADNLRVTGPTVVRIIDALERKQLVFRTRDERDRRIVLVSLTEEGVRVQRDCAEVHERRLATVMERLPNNTAEALLHTLAALLTAARPGEDASAALPAAAVP